MKYQNPFQPYRQLGAGLWKYFCSENIFDQSLDLLRRFRSKVRFFRKLYFAFFSFPPNDFVKPTLILPSRLCLSEEEHHQQHVGQTGQGAYHHFFGGEAQHLVQFEERVGDVISGSKTL